MQIIHTVCASTEKKIKLTQDIVQCLGILTNSFFPGEYSLRFNLDQMLNVIGIF